MSEQLPEDVNISRRSILAAGLALAASNGFPLIGEAAGRVYDALASPEKLIPGAIIALEPRESDTPVVSPLSSRECRGTPTNYMQHGRSAVLGFAPNALLWAEHTGTPLRSDEFRSAGVAVITTAEGPVNGKQEYCTLFSGRDQLIAVGYEGGLYMFEPALGQGGTEGRGEWVRMLTRSEESPMPAYAVNTTSWRDLESAEPSRLLIQKVVAGTNTLQHHGYRPWAAVLPSTQMPDMKRMELVPSDCAETIHGLIENGNGACYFITDQGDIVDLVHLRAKASQTLHLLRQLHEQYMSEEPNPEASIRYSDASPATFTFSVDRASLQPETLLDTVYSIMMTQGVLMEGISQRYGPDKIKAMKLLHPQFGGLDPEDLFSNSLGIVSMLTLIRQQNVMKKLETLHRINTGAAPEDKDGTIEQTLQEGPLVKQALTNVAHTFGVRKVEAPVTVTLPRGLYSLLPTKVTAADGATPTHLSARTIGIQPRNPNVRYTTTGVPAMQTAVERLLSKVAH